MVGKVTVRGQGPVRRRQTTTTFKKGGRVKKAVGGRLIAGTGKLREYVKDVSDATKKMSPHQDPRSERSAKMRHSLDNPTKKSKKSPSPHSPDKKKRSMGPSGAPKKDRKLGGMKPKKPSFKAMKKVLKAI